MTIERLKASLADRYTIERELGAGGMATVYLAEDIKHRRQVAIKVLRPDLAAALGPNRFMQEIEIAARLQHPHILPVHDSGSADGFLYYVMPYVEGESLRERLSRHGELPVHEAVRLLAEIADALTHAHGRGVVHRDIKPENIMLSGRHALVMDFGVAKAVSEASGRNRLTTAGVALGTPAYMAPEQASADPHLDHRVDIYALGVVGYELLAGRPPFTGASPQQVLAAHVMQQPEPVSVHRPSLSPALSGVIMKALEKRPADRWQTAEEMLTQLEPLMTPSGGMTPTETRPVAAHRTRRPRPRSLLIGTGTVAGAAVLWLLLHRPPATALLTSNTQITRLAGVEEVPHISPDGKSIVYVVRGPADLAPHADLRRTDGGDAIHLSAVIPTGWSPSGDRLLAMDPGGGNLRSIPVLGGQGTVIDPRGRWACWSPDGKQIAYFVGDSLLTVGVNREPPRLVTRALDPHSPAWSPDGKWIAFVSGNSSYFGTFNIAPSAVWLVAATGGTAWQLTSAGGINMSPTWAPDSRRLLLVSALAGIRDIYQINLTAGGRPRGAPVRITTGLNPSLISLSADGSELAYSIATNHSNIWKIAIPKTGWVSTQRALQVTTDVQTVEGISISHDGRWLAFDSDREGVQQIFRMPPGGGAAQELTHDSVPAFSPSLSPDGSSVAYHTVARGLRRVFVVGTDGGTPVEVSPGNGPDERAPNWSSDGRRIAWALGASVPTAAFATRDSQGHWGTPTTLTINGSLLTPFWADHGSLLLGVDSAGLPMLIPVDGGPARPLPEAHALSSLKIHSAATLSSDGQTLYIEYDPKALDIVHGTIYAVRLPGGAMREVVRFDELSRPHVSGSLSIAEYNGWLYFTLNDPESDIWVASVAGLKR